jgi:hypothetical protein
VLRISAPLGARHAACIAGSIAGRPARKRPAGRRSFRADRSGSHPSTANARATTEAQATALALLPADRAELAHALLESRHAHGHADADAAWLDDFDRRALAVSGYVAQLVDWDDARYGIAARLKAARREAALLAKTEAELHDAASELCRRATGTARVFASKLYFCFIFRR